MEPGAAAASEAAARRIEEFDLITPEGRWVRFRKFTRAEIWENRVIWMVAVVFSGAWWLLLLHGLIAALWR